MNILFVDDYISPLAGGSAERSMRIAKALVDQNHIVDLISLKKEFDFNFAKKNGINKIFLFSYVSFKYIIPIVNLKYIDKLVTNYDAIHISKNWSLLAFFIAISAKRKNIPYIFSPMGFITVHNNKSKLLKSLFLKFFTKRIIKNSSYCITVSNKEFNDCLNFIEDKSKIIQLPNGFVANDFLELTNTNFREKNNLSEKKIILALGRMDPIKGFHLLIEAFNNISNDFIDWQLVIVGPNNDYKNKLIKRSNELKSKNLISFLDPQYGDNKRHAYYACDIFVIPSIYDAMTIVAVEVAACGKPLIITKTSDFSGLIENNGAIGVSPTVEGITYGLKTLMNNNKLLVELGQNGKKYVYKNLEWTQLSISYNKIFKSLVNRTENNFCNE